MKRLVSFPSPTIFDVGANEGQTINEFCRVFKSPRIHAFEPSARVLDTLLAAAAAFPTVKVNRLALGSESGRKVFLENSHSVMSSFLEKGPWGWGDVVARREVETSTVDEYCAANHVAAIDILKTDTQGYDLYVLEGARRMLARKAIHLVFTEVNFVAMYDGMPPFDHLYRFLREHGFMLVTFYRIRYLQNRAAWTDAVFLQPDYIGRRSEPAAR
jgi:FkbM family methyltransferase